MCIRDSLESDHNGSMGKVLHVGKAVYNGLISAFLALNGFTGAGTIFDGDEDVYKRQKKYLLLMNLM